MNPFDDMTIEELYDELEQQGDRLSGGGGGGFIAECRVEIGYKAYLGKDDGLEQAETFVSFPFGNKEAQKAAEGTVKKMLAKAGKDARPQFGIQITALKDGALLRGEPVSWMGDRYFNTDWWTEASKAVVVPSLREAGIRTWPWTGWARVGFADDPWKVAQGLQDQEGQDGTMRYKQVAFVSEIFDSKEDAYAAAGGEDGVESTWKPLSDGWTAKDLLDTADTISKELGPGEKTVAQVAEDYGLDPVDVLVVFGVHLKEGPPNIVAGDFGVSVKDITAARKHGVGAPFG